MVLAGVFAVVCAIGQPIVLVVPGVVVCVRLLETDLLVQFGRNDGQSEQQHAGREQGGESGLEVAEKAHGNRQRTLTGDDSSRVVKRGER